MGGALSFCSMRSFLGVDEKHYTFVLTLILFRKLSHFWTLLDIYQNNHGKENKKRTRRDHLINLLLHIEPGLILGCVSLILRWTVTSPFVSRA